MVQGGQVQGGQVAQQVGRKLRQHLPAQYPLGGYAGDQAQGPVDVADAMLPVGGPDAFLYQVQ